MLAPFETLNALLQTRYSCRAFLDRPVAHSDIEKIVEAAPSSPFLPSFLPPLPPSFPLLPLLPPLLPLLPFSPPTL